MTNRGSNHRGERPFIEVPSSLGSPDATASPHGSVSSDGGRFLWRATWKQNPDLLGRPGNQFEILPAALRGPVRPCCRALPGILRAFLLGFLQPGLLDQDACLS